MELSKTSFDVDLDEIDNGIPWLKSAPSRDIEDDKLEKQLGKLAFNLVK